MSEEPLYPGETLGFRAWRLDPAGLLSINHDHRWASAAAEAQCLPEGRGRLRRPRQGHSESEVPAAGCDCGLFAYHTLDMAEYYGRMLGGWVLGAVSSSGRLRVYRHGVRAQRARVLALLLPPWGQSGEPARELERGASRIARELGVPLFGADQIRAFLEYCRAQPEVAPVPETAQPSRAASLAPAVGSLALWSLGVIASVLLVIHWLHGLSEAGAPSLIGERLSTPLTASLAVAASLAAIVCCWRALRRAEEIHFSNLLERIARIEQLVPQGSIRLRAGSRR